ncbi:MAG: response regulator [bacterium]
MNDNDSKKVLIVDDDPGILELYTDVLSSSGFKVDSVSNGQSALEILKNRQHQLILLDIMMPDMDGIQVLKSVRTDENLYGHPVVVMLTNLALTDNIKEALDSGADAYLIKLSLSNEQLIQQVRNYLFGFGK